MKPFCQARRRAGEGESGASGLREERHGGKDASEAVGEDHDGYRIARRGPGRNARSAMPSAARHVLRSGHSASRHPPNIAPGLEDSGRKRRARGRCCVRDKGVGRDEVGGGWVCGQRFGYERRKAERAPAAVCARVLLLVPLNIGPGQDQVDRERNEEGGKREGRETGKEKGKSGRERGCERGREGGRKAEACKEKDHVSER